MSAARGFVPDLLLEQYALGELNTAEKAELEAALAADPELRSRLARLEASDEAILAEAPPAEIAAAIRRRMLFSGSPNRRAFRPNAALLMPAAAAILVLVGAVMARGLIFRSVDDLNRPKGGAPSLSIYKKAASGPVGLADGSPAAAGDVLQIKYSAGQARFGAIFSIDGRAVLTRHLPPEDAAAAKAPLLAEAGAALGSAYELDDAPSFERFFLLSSTRDFDLSTASEALRALAAAGPQAATGAPRLPAGIDWKSILIVKKAASR